MLFTVRSAVTDVGRERLDMILMALVLEQDVSLFFIGNGVSHLAPVKHLQPTARPWTAAYASLPLYGLKSAFACEAALRQFEIDPADCVLPITPVDGGSLRQLYRSSDLCL